MDRTARCILFAYAAALVACSVRAPIHVRVDSVQRTTKTDPALIEGAMFAVSFGRRALGTAILAKLRAHRTEAPASEWPILDDLVALSAMSDAADAQCLSLTRGFAERYPNDFRIQSVHLALVESVGSQSELATFAAGLTSRFRREPIPYMVLAESCELEPVAPADEEAHTRLCLSHYAKCFESTQHVPCETKATELRERIDRPQCHGEHIDQRVHIRYGSDAPFAGGITRVANGRTVFVDPVDAYDATDFFRIVGSGHGATLKLTSSARLRPFRARDVVVLMKGKTALDSVRDTPKPLGTFEFSEAAVERLCSVAK